MSLQEMAQRARNRKYPPSPDRLRAQLKQTERGNAPWLTRMTDEELEENDPIWRAYVKHFRKQLAEATNLPLEEDA